MTSYEYTSAPRAVSVLPRHASRRLTRRDGLLPLVLALELLAGVAFGVAAHAGSSTTTSVPAKVTFGPVVTVLPTMTGPAVGPLLPGTVRGAMPVAIAPLAAAPVLVSAPKPKAHAPRNPFATLVTVKP